MIDQLKHAIACEIADTEAIENHELTPENREFLLDTMTTKIRASIAKYIDGSQKHGDDFLTDVAHLNELAKELTDADFYLAAAQRKAALYDKRTNI